VRVVFLLFFVLIALTLVFCTAIFFILTPLVKEGRVGVVQDLLRKWTYLFQQFKEFMRSSVNLSI